MVWKQAWVHAESGWWGWGLAAVQASRTLSS